MQVKTYRPGLLVTASYALLSVVLTWPLAKQLRSALPGDPAGDTGIYVWNLWVFRYELLQHRHLPFTTEQFFAFTGATDFTLHNYAPIAGLLALPLIGWIGIVGAFNAVLLIFLATSGAAIYLLAREVGLSRVAAWIAGALFMASPLVSARETAHLSLVANAPLALFLWALLRALKHPSVRAGCLVGLLVAVATYCDAYYGIFCVVMGVTVLAWQFVRVERDGEVPGSRGWIRWLDAVCLLLTALIAWPALAPGLSTFRVGTVPVNLRDPYAPALALVVLAGVRAWLTWRPRIRVDDPDRRLKALLPSGVWAVGTCLVLMAPVIEGLAVRFSEGRLAATRVFWRSSPRGVDLLAYVVPNPTHAWLGQWTGRWLLPEAADAFPELVASCSLVAVAGIAIAAARRWLPGLWLAFTGFFVLLSLGPFIHVAGLNTYVIGPWALLRYVPVIGLARSPSRFAIVAAIGVSLLAAFGADRWMARRHGRLPVALAAMIGLAALELIPGPRLLHSAAVPEAYRLIASASGSGGALLELPTGIRDGTSSLGDFSASTAFFQTSHQRPVVGGYLSRVSDWRKQESLRMPLLRALFQLSAGDEPLSDDLREAALGSVPVFLRRTCVRYVIVDKLRASAALRSFAAQALSLVPLHEDERYDLLEPSKPPPCDHAMPADHRRASTAATR